MKIVIVGAGPIGCYAAQLLKKDGFRPVLIEEHREVGKPIHCAGLIGKDVFKDSKIPLSKKSIINTINGATIHLDEERISLNRKEVAYVIDREIFDKELGKDLEIGYKIKFLGLEKINSGYIIETDKGDIKADLVIGADGALSSIRQAIGAKSSVKYLKGVQFRMRTNLKEKDFVHVYLKKPYFYWLIPETKNTIRVGVISENPYHNLLDFLKENSIKGEVLEKFAGSISIGLCQILKERVALVGDAGCQMKPSTYGGIYYGMRAAEILSMCIKEDRLEKYPEIWRERFEKEIKIGLKIRKIYETLTSDNLKKIFCLIKKESRLIEKIADFENHSLSFFRLIRDSIFSKEIGSIVWNLLRS